MIATFCRRHFFLRLAVLVLQCEKGDGRGIRQNPIRQLCFDLGLWLFDLLRHA
jgi:hypothetical protein